MGWVVAHGRRSERRRFSVIRHGATRSALRLSVEPQGALVALPAGVEVDHEASHARRVLLVAPQGAGATLVTAGLAARQDAETLARRAPLRGSGGGGGGGVP